MMRIALPKESTASFCHELDRAGLAYTVLQSPPGVPMAAVTMIDLVQTAALYGAIASVFVAWIRARASRKIILTLKDKKIIHLEGYSVEQIKQILPLVDHLTAVDIAPDKTPENPRKLDS